MADAAKKEEVDAKKAEVKKRLQDEAALKKKKGFMTPERKKALRLIIRKKSAELLEKERQAMNADKLKAVMDRCGEAKTIDGIPLEELIDIVKQYHERSYLNESQKWDLEFDVRRSDLEIHELNSRVNDLRGKFQKPKLKKVSQYENKFAKLQKKAVNEFNFKGQLKSVGK
ncbi:unnamed protein product, partial [Meganyctiphanes norvegica]